MNVYTAKKFKLKFNQNPNNVFDLIKEANYEIKRACFEKPSGVIRAHFGHLSLAGWKDIPYCITVNWRLMEYARQEDPDYVCLRAQVDQVILFKNEDEFNSYRASVEKWLEIDVAKERDLGGINKP